MELIGQSKSTQQAAPNGVFPGVLTLSVPGPGVLGRGGLTTRGFDVGTSTRVGEGDGLGSGAGTRSVRLGGADPPSSEQATSLGTSKTAAVASAAPART